MSEQGFEKIKYQGKEMLPDLDVDDSTGVAYFQHFYRTGFPPSTYRRHACMHQGYWCWKQAREHPLDVIKFLFRRLR